MLVKIKINFVEKSFWRGFVGSGGAFGKKNFFLHFWGFRPKLPMYTNFHQNLRGNGVSIRWFQLECPNYNSSDERTLIVRWCFELHGSNVKLSKTQNFYLLEFSSGWNRWIFFSLFVLVLPDFYRFLPYEVLQISRNHILHSNFINDLLIFKRNFWYRLDVCMPMVKLSGFLNLTHVIQSTIVQWRFLYLCYNFSH